MVMILPVLSAYFLSSQLRSQPSSPLHFALATSTEQQPIKAFVGASVILAAFGVDLFLAELLVSCVCNDHFVSQRELHIGI